MKRINSIDTVRGICIWIMIFGHALDWWINQENYWFRMWMYGFLESVGTIGFLFISGISAGLAYKKNISKAESNEFDMLAARNLYFFRAFIILIIGFLYNMIVILIWGGEIADIWSWLVLQTIGFSLILSWPLLKTTKYIRITLSFIVIFANQILLDLLLPYHGQFNLLGITFHLLFNPTSQYVILTYFGIFLVGTVVGDFLFDIIIFKNERERKLLFKNKFIIPTLIIGINLLVFGIIFEFPEFLIYGTISSIAYSFGLILITLSILITFEIFKIIKTTKSYKFLFYYSYYSFTIYLAHNLLYFLFPGQLNYIEILIFWIIGTAVFGFLFRTIYHNIGSKASLKAVISILSLQLTRKFMNKKLLMQVDRNKYFFKSDK